MGEFVNPKYADEAKTVFKKPTRLECMMQDYPKVRVRRARVRAGGGRRGGGGGGSGDRGGGEVYSDFACFTC